jgi:hypothetical protein
MKIQDCFVTLAPHPRVPGVARKVYYEGHSHSHARKLIEVSCVVRHQLAATGADLSGDVPDRHITLQANDRNWIDTQTFANVEPTLHEIRDEQGNVTGQEFRYPPTAVNEYDFWLIFFENPIPDFFAFLTQILALRASQGRFD